MKVIEVENVSVRREGRAILDDLQWVVQEGERWVVLGPNGAGKTTLVQLVSGRMHPSSGVVRIVGEQVGKVDLQEIRPLVGVASAALDDRFEKESDCLSVVLSSAYGFLARGREKYEEEDIARAMEIMERFSVASLSKRMYGTLSTGERKRVQIARALMSNPEILIIDEPTAGLDLKGREELLQDITSLANDTYAPVMVLVTHHVEEIPAGFTHILMLKDGKKTAEGTLVQTLTEANLSTCFDLPLQIVATAGRWAARAIREV